MIFTEKAIGLINRMPPRDRIRIIELNNYLISGSPRVAIIEKDSQSLIYSILNRQEYIEKNAY